MNIAIIGAGISGIATAIILQKAGHKVTLYEKNTEIGGVWAMSYPDVRLQNVGVQYCFSDFPWPKKPDQHPTAAQITDYLKQAITHFSLDVRTGHQILSMEEKPNGWTLNIENAEGTSTIEMDYVISAIGQYSGGKNRPEFKGESIFKGQIITERDVKDLSIFSGKKVAVVGFGKSALDMATLAGKNGAEVEHIFRTPRWTIPFKIMGIHYTYPLFSRFGSVMMSSWAHPSKVEQVLHQKMSFVVNGFWKMLSGLFATQMKANAWFKGKDAKQRIHAVLPDHPFTMDLRSAAALEPVLYYPYVAKGIIQPHQGTLQSFTEKGIKLQDGCEIDADIVVLSLGSQKPRFPFMPENYRSLLEQEKDGVQLYRHIIHPDIPNFAFAGYNHGFMHVPAAEVGAAWLAAVLDGDLKLPTSEDMKKAIEYMCHWKREHIHFEPSRSCAINTRYQQYLDIMLKELQVSPYRKSNPVAEVFGRYEASDYLGVYEEYINKKEKRKAPLSSLELWT
ncbi:NAD(P)/FAD-dependent oxidoreductase [Algivirga pacifica]|uniref:NAD(P)/FAD-dependent oxidoreductase n=1 Tax=Algivirga pacifica TaxID=1162670 RepID=A0ABP9DER2_9BACT